MDTLDYPCGCSYQLTHDRMALLPAITQCPEHRRAVERAAAAAEAGQAGIAASEAGNRGY